MADVRGRPPGGRSIPLLRSSAGIDWYWEDDEDGPGAKAYAVQEVTSILEQNQAMAGHNDGYTKDRSMARIASIPLTVIYRWMTENPGFDPFSQDPDCQKKLCQLLDSNEWRYLRTSELILGDSWRHSI